jgi:hypothetical protein
MSIVLIAIFSSGMFTATGCTGEWEMNNNGFGFANLDCSSVQQQAYAGSPVAPGVGTVIVNGQQYDYCVPQQAQLQQNVSDPDGSTTILFYRCPGSPTDRKH